MQQRQAAAMVDVRVAQDYRVDRGGFEWKRRAIAQVGVVAALDHAAVEQDGAALHLDDVARAGDFTGRAVELQVHRANRLRRSAVPQWLRLPVGPRTARSPASRATT